jgi:hypothetical protein
MLLDNTFCYHVTATSEFILFKKIMLGVGWQASSLNSLELNHAVHKGGTI